MDDHTLVVWLAAVVAIAILLRAMILAREVLITRAITTGDLYGAAPLFPWRYLTIQSTAAFLAERTETVCAELVSRMFFIPVRAASRTAPQWLLWQRAHIPSYAVCVRKRDPVK